MIEKKTIWICEMCNRVFFRKTEIPSNNIHESKNMDAICRGKVVEKNFISVESLKEAWRKLMDKTNDLHDLECGSCDGDVKEFESVVGVKND